ncbi:VOC family protein [Parvularcula flava]|uniref:Bleomycin resistance protein n=1 Tax=Aquisalinus luteolus TaxID=1566827 RepID=A0A8J3A183_9PROT|nr:VOC family protein [Aquisalinus luteolus]NHK27264.1 VOC family protein [Aquisalinus luteolus]GGH94908.1 hypothetical protein GCM10011355_10200 [Aquisalinus luteolus]
MTGKFAKAIPLFAAQDIGAAMRWYEERLGFTQRFEYPDYGIISRDDIILNFWLCKDRHIAENTSAYFNVENIDDLYAEFRERSAETRMTEPKDFDYGMREFHIWDLDGNLLRLGQPLPE